MLEARNIGRMRHDESGWLLRDVSLTIEAGNRIALTGATGSGKTIFLRSLAMLDAIDEGTILWCGEPPTLNDIPTYRSLAIYLMQRASLFAGTVEENLMAPYFLAAHKNREYSRERILEQLEGLNFDKRFLANDTANISGGETQIVALLRAMQLDPMLLFLDEPTASLDATTTGQVEQLVADWISSDPTQRAFVWVTHDAAQASRLANRTFQLREGRLIEAEAS
jgi:UDP-glucose/iron transport system ATP-binding protein